MGQSLFRQLLGLLLLPLSMQVTSAVAIAASDAALPYILMSDAETLRAVRQDIRKVGGHYLREFEFAKGAVASLNSRALSYLESRHPNLTALPDIQVRLIHPLAKPANPGGKNQDPVQPPQSVPWGISAIQATQAHATRGEGVVVCVVDTGIDKDHPDLAANIVGGRNFIAAKGALDSNNWDDDNGHGSHVSGTVAALDNTIGVVGVAPNAKLYGVKVLDRRGSGTLSGVIDGINECISAGTHVINMSLGAAVSPTSSTGLLMQAAVDSAKAAGIEVVVAAGNNGADLSNYIPAGLSNLIAVAAVDRSMNFPYWSNYGLRVTDLSAPGVSIASTWKNGGYDTISGTSMASPHVAGVAALRIAAGLSNYGAIDLGRPLSIQGAGFIDALLTLGF